MELTLSALEQSALRRLLWATPEPGAALIPHDALTALAELVPCDVIGVGEADSGGWLLSSVELPADSYDFLGPRVCQGPLSTGLEHLRASLADPTAPRETGSAVDTVRIGHETAAGTVIQLYLDRAHGVFSHRDVAMLRLVEPVVVRLMTTRPRIAPNGNLSLAELRVLELLSSGASNRDISERLFVSVATVRKHLEHCYRKLGVTNRTAAVAALSGREAVTDLVDSRIG